LRLLRVWCWLPLLVRLPLPRVRLPRLLA